ncbi:5011_t:CDS:2, partial [Acaulospora morrowiae]
SIDKDLSISQDIRDIVQNLIKNRKIRWGLWPGALYLLELLVGTIQVLKWSADIKKINSLWEKATKEERASPSSSMLGKRQREANIVDSSSKKQCVVPDISCFCPDVEVPLQANGSVDVLEVVKSTVRTFNPKKIALGSSRSYKSSNHLLVDSKQNVKVPRESTYDAEMYRILANWLAKVHG